MPKPKSLLKESKPKKKTVQQVCNSYFTFTSSLWLDRSIQKDQNTNQW